MTEYTKWLEEKCRIVRDLFNDDSVYNDHRYMISSNRAWYQGAYSAFTEALVMTKEKPRKPAKRRGAKKGKKAK